MKKRTIKKRLEDWSENLKDIEIRTGRALHVDIADAIETLDACRKAIAPVLREMKSRRQSWPGLGLQTARMKIAFRRLSRLK